MASSYRRHNSSRRNTSVAEIHQQLDTGKTTGDFSSYSPATVLMFALSSFGAALALVPILLPDSQWLESIEIYRASLRTLLSIIVSIICLLLVYYKRKSIKLRHCQGVDNATIMTTMENEEQGTDSLIPTPHEAPDKQAKYMLTTIIIFGICSLASSILQTVIEPIYKSVLRDMVYCIFDVLSLCSQMIFFFYYIRERLPNIRGLHYAIAVLIGIKISTWIAVSLAPLCDHGDTSGGNTSGIEPKSNDTNMTDVNPVPNPVLAFFDEFFETFYTEFHTIVVGVLFYVWHSMDSEKFNPLPSLTRIVSNQNETTFLLCDYSLEIDIGMEQDSIEIRRRNRAKLLFILLSTVLATGYATICILTTRDKVFTQPENIYIYRGLTLFYYSVFDIIAICVLYSLRSQADTNSPHFNSSEYILLFTACSESVYYFLRGVASIGSLASRDSLSLDQTESTLLFQEDVAVVDHLMAGVFLSYSFVAITNCWMQTMLLIVLRRKQVSALVKNILILFAGVNFAEWLQSAILLGLAREDTVPRFTPVMNSFFGPDIARIFILILLPTYDDIISFSFSNCVSGTRSRNIV
ncbi:uncharacterized protein [Amphiura filiformis]|uniref:uncharacterized protein n=1 Tax=Amphiura filiformis TaxID=82378 RepID=UPI003B226EB2